MVRYLPMLMVALVTLYAFFDVVATDRRRIRTLNKPAWLLVALLPVIGALLWTVVGRPRRSGPARAGDVIQVRDRTRPLAPDDDPEFLRVLEQRAWAARRAAQRQAGDPAAGASVKGPSDGQGGPGAGPASDGLRPGASDQPAPGSVEAADNGGGRGESPGSPDPTELRDEEPPGADDQRAPG